MKDRSKPLSLRTFKYIYAKVPRLCVDIVVKNSQGILLTQRSIPPSQGWWHLPGGTILFKESAIETVKRAAKRELGVSVSIIKFLGLIEYYKYNSVLGHTISLTYLVEPTGKIKLNNEVSDFGYFKKPPQNTLREVKDFLKNSYDKNFI